MSVDMIVNKHTMMIKDFGEYTNYDNIYKHVCNMSYGKQSEVTEALENLRPMFLEWVQKVGANSTQGLLLMSTVFPLRVLMSLIEKGYVKKS